MSQRNAKQQLNRNLLYEAKTKMDCQKQARGSSKPSKITFPSSILITGLLQILSFFTTCPLELQSYQVEILVSFMSCCVLPSLGCTLVW